MSHGPVLQNLAIDPDWAHLRKLSSRTGCWFPPPGNPVENSARQHQLADAYVDQLTSEGGSEEFSTLPDSSSPGSTIIWRDTWVGRAEVGTDGRSGHLLYTTTPEGRECRIWVADEHCVGSTGIEALSGRRHRTVIGSVVDVGDDFIDLQPVVVGHLRLAEGKFGGRMRADSLQVRPEQVAEFSQFDPSKRATARARRMIETMGEDEVKATFAELVGEPYVPKDWGGERSDLNTTRLRVDGEPLEASFVFKGPGAPKKMVIATLGKNGDQIARALTEEPDLVVVQHYGAIDATVRHLLERYCFFETYNRHRRTRWMVLDGATTAQILEAHGKL